MSIENIRIAKGSISDRVYAGYLNKDKQTWRQKVDVTNDFLAAVIERWNGYEEIITSSDGKKYKMSVREIRVTNTSASDGTTDQDS
jgi:hypothetical protein